MITSDRDTKSRILDAAEALFAEHGFQATSLRAITRQADANLAAVNYHFGSKEELITAIFQRRIAPIHAERVATLDAAEARHHPEPVPLEELLNAFVRPAVRCLSDPDGSHRYLFRLMGRIHAETPDHLQCMLLQLFGDVTRRFLEAARKTLPGLTPVDVAWRFHFMIATVIHTMSTIRDAERTSGGLCTFDDEDAVVHRLVTFLAAGWRAPSPETGSPHPDSGSPQATSEPPHPGSGLPRPEGDQS